MEEDPIGILVDIIYVFYVLS